MEETSYSIKGTLDSQLSVTIKFESHLINTIWWLLYFTSSITSCSKIIMIKDMIKKSFLNILSPHFLRVNPLKSLAAPISNVPIVIILIVSRQVNTMLSLLPNFFVQI